MNTKKPVKKLTYDDFMTQDILSESVKMELMKGEEVTEHYLMVESPFLAKHARTKISWAVKNASIKEQSGLIEDEAEKIFTRDQLIEDVNIEFALTLISGWSFGEATTNRVKKILEQNTGLATLVINKGYSIEATRSKK